MFNKYKSFILKKVKLTSKNMKTSTIIESVESINLLINEPILDDKGNEIRKPNGQLALKPIALPAQLSFKLAMLLKEISPIVETFNKVRAEKIKEFGTPKKDKEGKDTGEYTFIQKNGENFQKELEKMGNEEVSINIPDIKIAEFEGLKIKTGILLELSWLIKE